MRKNLIILSYDATPHRAAKYHGRGCNFLSLAGAIDTTVTPPTLKPSPWRYTLPILGNGGYNIGGPLLIWESSDGPMPDDIKALITDTLRFNSGLPCYANGRCLR